MTTRITKAMLIDHRLTHNRDNSWWLKDARGIPCCRVCAACIDAAKAEYRPEIFEDGNYEADEPIEADE